MYQFARVTLCHALHTKYLPGYFFLFYIEYLRHYRQNIDLEINLLESLFLVKIQDLRLKGLGFDFRRRLSIKYTLFFYLTKQQRVPGAPTQNWRVYSATNIQLYPHQVEMSVMLLSLYTFSYLRIECQYIKVSQVSECHLKEYPAYF